MSSENSSKTLEELEVRNAQLQEQNNQLREENAQLHVENVNCRIQKGQMKLLVKSAKDQLEHFNILLQQLGLSDESVSIEKFDKHSPKIAFEESRTVAVNGPTYDYNYILGENVYQQGIVNFKLKLESFKDNNWMFVGIVKEDVVPEDSSSCNWPGSYGWELGKKGYVRKNETGGEESAIDNLIKQGDTVELVLDCDAAKLSLHLHTGQQLPIEIPKSLKWRLNVNLAGANDKIRIINAC